MNRFFAPGGEFAGIERMFSPERFARDGQGLGDDAFVWTPAAGETWVASMDTSVEGVHFRLDWMSRPEALRKALLSNLSDLNAMGARTRFALFALGATPAYEPETFEALGAALRELEEVHGFKVTGGDTTRTSKDGDAEFFTFTVCGVVQGRPLLRSAARPGHTVYVSGTLGGSSAGLACYRDQGAARRTPPEPAERAAREALMQAHRAPQPPLELGPLLARMNAERAATGDAVAAIDLSDGLSSELGHLARRSGCALTIDFEKLPAHPALDAAGPLMGNDRRAHLVNGGEEYQLLFTGTFTADELARLRAVTAVTAIGAVTAGDGVFLIADGATRPLAAGGFQHGTERVEG